MMSIRYVGRHREVRRDVHTMDTLPAPVDPWAATDPNLATRRTIGGAR